MATRRSRRLAWFAIVLVAGCVAPHENDVPSYGDPSNDPPVISVYEDKENHTVYGKLEEYRMDRDHCTVGYGPLVPEREFTSEYQNLCDAAFRWLHKRTRLTYDNETDTVMVKLALLSEDS